MSKAFRTIKDDLFTINYDMSFALNYINAQAFTFYRIKIS